MSDYGEIDLALSEVEESIKAVERYLAEKIKEVLYCWYCGNENDWGDFSFSIITSALVEVCGDNLSRMPMKGNMDAYIALMSREIRAFYEMFRKARGPSDRLH